MFNRIVNMKLGCVNVSFMIAKLQRLEGITSSVVGSKDKHYIFWDFDNEDLDKIKAELQYQQWFYDLGNIYILADNKPKSYRAICLSKRTFKEMLEIVLKTQYVDFGYFISMVRRQKAVIRMSKKEGRIKQNCSCVIEGKEKTEISKKVNSVIYQTGSGIKNVFIGFDKGVFIEQ